MKIQRTIEIAAPPERVYEVVMDPRHLEDWVTIHDHLQDAPDGSLEKGSELTQCLKLAGRRFNVHWEVVENDPCRRVVWDGQGPVHSHARVVYEFERNGKGTKFSYSNEYDLPGGVLGRMAGGAVRRVTGKEVDATLAKLKDLVE
ncbi:MAG TPA: SRPBCC family protein [Thermoleophilaceae bacterium]|jgi:carbon monoxide dehydrogenase subunit G